MTSHPFKITSHLSVRQLPIGHREEEREKLYYRHQSMDEIQHLIQDMDLSNEALATSIMNDEKEYAKQSRPSSSSGEGAAGHATTTGDISKYTVSFQPFSGENHIGEGDTSYQSADPNDHDAFDACNNSASYQRYQYPTIASSLPPYLYAESERVKNSYRTGSFWSVKSLPSLLEAGEVTRARKQQVVNNLLSSSRRVFKPSSLLVKHEFAGIVYSGTDHDKLSNLHKIGVEEEKIRIDSYSRRPFLVSSRIRSKFEDIFFDPATGKEVEEERVIHRLDSITRSDINVKSKFIHGAFHTSTGRRRGLGAGGGGGGASSAILGKKEDEIALIQRWCRDIYEALARDWSGSDFKVKYHRRSQEVVVQFRVPTTANGEAADNNGRFPPANNALGKYMMQLAVHGVASSHGLQKRGDRWQVLEREVSSEVAPMDERPQDGDHLLHSHDAIRQQLGAAAEGYPPTEHVGNEEEYRWFIPPNNNGSAGGAMVQPPSAAVRRVSFDQEQVDNSAKTTLPQQQRQQQTTEATAADLTTSVSSPMMSLVYSYYLTFAFFAPWVTSVSRKVHTDYAQAQRLKSQVKAKKKKQRIANLLADQGQVGLGPHSMPPLIGSSSLAAPPSAFSMPLQQQMVPIAVRYNSSGLSSQQQLPLSCSSTSSVATALPPPALIVQQQPQPLPAGQQRRLSEGGGK